MDSGTRTGSENSDSCGWPEKSKSLAENLTETVDSNLVTPNGKMDLRKSGGVYVSSSSGSGSSEISPNAGSDSSSLESDSESESFYSTLNNQLVSPGNTDSQKEKLVGDESIVKIMKQKNYRELNEKILKYEEELKVTNLKLRASEQEVEKLRGEIEKNQSAVVLAGNFHAELEAARREIEKRDADIEAKKRWVPELQNQVLDLEIKLSDSNSKKEVLVSELEDTRGCLAVSEAEILKLREILSDCQQNFSAEKVNMQTNIDCLSEKHTSLETQLKHLQSHCELLEDQIRCSDSEKSEMRASFDTQKVQWQAEINTLKAELAMRADHIENLNKDFDKHKLKYDMLVTEKDMVSAKVDNLNAERRSRDIQIGQMEDNLNQLLHKQNELVFESATAKNAEQKLRVRVEELEKEIERQRNVILEAEEEKREAIRQLCFSLDHYRSGYRQLVRSLSGNSRGQAVLVL